LASLGLRGIGQQNVVELSNPSVLGMVRAVYHLVDVEPIAHEYGLIERASSFERDLGDINSSSLSFEFDDYQYLKALSVDSDVAVTWSLEISLARTLKKLTHLLPNSRIFEESSGEVWWRSGRKAEVDAAAKAFSEACRQPSSVSFLRVGYHGAASHDFSFSWLSPRSTERGYAQGGLRCRRGDFKSHSKIIASTATYRVARSMPELVPRILQMR
jgi:hypothetical protein